MRWGHETSQALITLAASAGEFGVIGLQHTTGVLRFVLPVPLSDGSTSNYELVAAPRNKTVSVRENNLGQKLPKSCPDRHINGDGTFCMYWSKIDELEVTDRDSAEKWWGTLIAFLRLQERANRQRRWPGLEQWAHGDAAYFQWQAMTAVTKLGEPYITALKEERLDVVKRRNALRVHLDGKWIYSVNMQRKMVVNLRRSCICTPVRGAKAKVIKACDNHAGAAADLAFGLLNWDRAEREFWKSKAHEACCQTMDTCPLNKHAA